MPILGILASSKLTAAAGDYESIATVTVGSGGSATVSFTSIPADFTHLQLRAIYSDSGTNPAFNLELVFNSDTGNNYARHLLSGNGTAASATATASTNFIGLPYFSNDASAFGASVTDILDYTNTNKYTTVRSLGGIDLNGSGYSMLRSGVWMNTAAITSITLTSDAASASFRQYSHFALYGLRTA